ncbi:MAG: glutathione S-transferase [Rhodobacteraceae bacterium]|nr:glutathione S-transferase [Paracoccaceae bacterium]
MTYKLVLGDYAYSSWSLRAWLLFEKFNIPRDTSFVSFSNPATVADQMPNFAPARTVPAIKTPDGVVLGDSLALAEELASRHPGAGLWPQDPAHRAAARAITAEMHSSFSALRTACPMSLYTGYDWSNPSDEVRADLARIETLWAYARDICKADGPWLCGAYSIADAFYAPVAARIAGFSLPVSAPAQGYVAAHLNDPAFRRWRSMALANGVVLERYAQTHAVLDWPGPATVAAKAVTGQTPENDACPYSGKAAKDCLQLEDGRVFGFCNPFCRDKTVADPMAWPAFVELAFPDTPAPD